MSHRQTDLNYRGLGALTPERLRQVNEQRRIIAIGRASNGSGFLVTAPPQAPADFPTDEEIAAICTPNKFDLMAKAIRSLIDDEDWAAYTMDAYVEEREEERREQW